MSDAMAHAPQDVQLLNMQTVESMFAIAEPGDRFAHELYDVFLTQSDLVTTEMISAAASGDQLKVKQLCHRLKGSAANLGATALASKSADVESLLKAGELADTATLSAWAGEIRSLFLETRTHVSLALKSF